MTKSPDAFRTISEVSELLETPAHVLRFWETRFPQIRPVKRAGGRRYYRPADVALLTGIKRLLHDDGVTIRGVQKILREQGVRHVSGVAEEAGDDTDGTMPPPGHDTAPVAAATAQIIALQTVPQAAIPRPDAGVEPPLPDTEAAGTDLPEHGSAPEKTMTEADWSGDEDDLGDLPQDAALPVADPPAPVMAQGLRALTQAAPPATRAAPVVEDLFARLPAATPPLRSPAPPPDEPVPEAPMAVWAEDSTQGDQPEPAAATVTVMAHSVRQPARDDISPEAPSTTLAHRLRARASQGPNVADRQRFAMLRDQALALRARLAAPPRTKG